jgi:bisanhydrobacterioruberin hydratase
MERSFNGLFLFFVFWYICGFVLVGFNLLPSWLEWSNSVFIITSGILAIFYFQLAYGVLKGLIISSSIFISTFVVEYLGSTTSFLFGDYFYTNQFAPNLLGVPLAIGFAWIMVIATGHTIIQILHIRSALLKSFVGGAAALAMDLVLDPVAYVVKGYWIWEESGNYYGIPWTNFFGWFLIAFLLHLLLAVIPERQIPTTVIQKMLAIYAGIILLFGWIALLDGLYLVTCISVGITLLCVFLAWVKRGVTYD